jgi:hypothetical protein
VTAAPLGLPMQQQRPPDHVSVSFPDVSVLQDEGNRLLCVIADKEVWVPVAAIRRGSQVWAVGDCGTLSVARWFAVRARLLEADRDAANEVGDENR